MNDKIRETAFVIGVQNPKQKRFEALDNFGEIQSLAESAGAKASYAELVEIRQISPATFLGQGKVEEIRQKTLEHKPDLIVVDAELSPVQSRNLEQAWCTRVVDRTGLILDIFALQAKSKEGKLQVELAQYHYLLPRLVRQWTHLSKQRGGAIGLRGPGETQLEVDRRRARERITQLKKNLEKVTSAREIHRQKRQAVPMPTISLIGYTNAGKSTLFNSLLNAHVIAEDKLFSTLDPKTKKLRLPSGQNILMTDTVGFIRNLPHELVESFKSTFEEAAESDLLVHVIDASHPNRTQRIETVEKVLTELNLSHIPIIKVLNKMDCVATEISDDIKALSHGDSVKLSALTGEGTEDLLLKIEDVLSRTYYRSMRLFIPHAEYRLVNDLYTHGRVLTTRTGDDGTVVEASLPPKWQNVYRRYELEPELELISEWEEKE